MGRTPFSANGDQVTEWGDATVLKLLMYCISCSIWKVQGNYEVHGSFWNMALQALLPWAASALNFVDQWVQVCKWFMVRNRDCYKTLLPSSIGPNNRIMCIDESKVDLFVRAHIRMPGKKMRLYTTKTKQETLWNMILDIDRSLNKIMSPNIHSNQL